MSGFVDRLVARGSGLEAVPGFAALRPRPLSRFESSSEPADGPEGADTLETGLQSSATAPLAAAGSITTARGPAPRSIPPPIDAAVGTIEAHPIMPSEWMDRAEVEEMRPIGTLRSQAVDPGPGSVTVPLPEAPLRHDAATVPPIREAVHVVSLPPAPASMPSSAGETAPPIAHPVPVETTRPRKPTDRAPQPIAGRPPAPHVTATADDTISPVTVTVGRIDVHFVQPQPPSTLPPQAPRTRGFEAYARARRGQPRQER